MILWNHYFDRTDRSGGWIRDKATFRITNFIGWKASQSQEKYIKERGAVPKGIQQRKPPCGKN